MATRRDFQHKPSAALSGVRRRAADAVERFRGEHDKDHASKVGGQRRPGRNERLREDLTGGEADFAKVHGRSTDIMGLRRKGGGKEDRAQRNVGKAKEQTGRSDLRPLDLNIPITRPKRLTTEDGRTSFHFSHDAIMKTSRETVDEAGRANRPGAAKAHNKYIERDSAVALADADLAKDAAELDGQAVNDNAPRAALATAPGQGAYIERQEALAIQPDGSRVLFTNIDNDPAQRAEFWRLVEKHERDPAPDRMSFTMAANPAFWNNVRHHAECPPYLAAAIDAADPAKKVTIKTDGNVEMRRFLSGVVGWTEIGKKGVGEDANEYAARRAKAVAKFSDGRGGRVQYRIIGELPHELDLEGRASILRNFAKHFEELRLPYVAVMHAPDHTNSDKNWHFHLVYYDRPADRLTESRIKAYAEQQAEKTGAQAEADLSLVGRWDFDIVAHKRDKWRNRWTDNPFMQPKVERVAQTNTWIAELRQSLSDITNDHLERAGINRRLDHRRHSEMGIHAEPQEHLGTKLANLEAMGIATPTGVSNEEIQWKSTLKRIDDGLTRRKNGVERRADRWMDQLDRATLSVETKTETRANVIRWHQHQTEAEEHGAIAENLREHMERLLSRANKVKETCERHLEAIERGKATRFQASRKKHFETRLLDAKDFLEEAVKTLAKENDLARECEVLRGREQEAADELELKIDSVLNPRHVRAREEERVAEAARAAGNAAVAATANDMRRAINRARMDEWIEDIRNNRRRLVRRGRVIVPANEVASDAEITGALNYSAMQSRLAGIKKQQDAVIADVVKHIGRNPLIVKPRAAGAEGPEFTLSTPRSTLAQAFIDYADDQAIVTARQEALEARQRLTDRNQAHDAQAVAERAQESAKSAAELEAGGVSEVSQPDQAANDEGRAKRVANGVPRQIVDRLLSDVSDKRRRISLVGGIASVDRSVTQAVGIDEEQVRDQGIQRRLIALASVHERELKRLTAYVASHADKVVQTDDHFVLSRSAPRELFEIARAWRDDHQVSRMMADARQGHLRAEAEMAAARQPQVGVPEPEQPRPETPRVTTLQTDDSIREEAMAAARKREEDRRRAEEAERAKHVAPARDGGRRKRTELSSEEVARIVRAAAPGRQHRPTSANPRLEAWTNAVKDGMSAEDRRRLAAQVLNDREARAMLAEIDPELARRIRAEAEQANRDRQIGLDLGLTPKR